MAKGDVISNIATVGTGANLEYQPAAGVEAVITSVGTSSNTTDMDVQLYDGSLSSTQKYGTAGEINMKIFVNNTRRLLLGNRNVASKALSFTGVQVK